MRIETQNLLFVQYWRVDLAGLDKPCPLRVAQAKGYVQACMNTNPTPTIRELYPNLTDTELAEAEDYLERYLALVLRIFERVASQTVPQADPLAPGAVPLSSTMSGSKASQ